MPEHSIHIVNKVGSGRGGGGSGASAKKDRLITRLYKEEKVPPKELIKKSTLQKNAKFTGRVVTSSTSFMQGNANGMMKVAAIKGFGVGVAILQATEALAKFGISVMEAETGNAIASSNAKATIGLASSFGMGLIAGSIKNEIFTKRIINRQNLEKEYGRELYNLNNNGEKYKVR